jgi:hypothetical protein
MSLATLHHDDGNSRAAPDTGSPVGARRTFDWSFGLLLLVGCVLFVLARAVAAEHNVQLIDRYDLWLLGLVPMIGLVVLGSVFATPAQKTTGGPAAARMYVLTWILSLSSFILLQDAHIAERLSDPLLSIGNFQTRDFADFVLCFVYSSLGAGLAFLLGKTSLTGCRQISASALAILLPLDAVLMFVFIFWSRFAS